MFYGQGQHPTLIKFSLDYQTLKNYIFSTDIQNSCFSFLYHRESAYISQIDNLKIFLKRCFSGPVNDRNRLTQFLTLRPRGVNFRSLFGVFFFFTEIRFFHTFYSFTVLSFYKQKFGYYSSVCLPVPGAFDTFFLSLRLRTLCLSPVFRI